MCVLSKFFLKKTNFEEMSADEINKYIDSLNKKITDETVASNFSDQTENHKKEIYKIIEKRDRAMLSLQQKVDVNK